MRSSRLTAAAVVVAVLVIAVGIEWATTMSIEGGSTDTRHAFPGELIALRLSPDWINVGSSNPVVVTPIFTGDSNYYFIAGLPGSSRLHALFAPRCLRAVPRCMVLEMIWSVEVDVG